MSEDREQPPASAGGRNSAPPPAPGTARPSQGSSRSSRAAAIGLAVLAILTYALMADAAVETALSGSPVRWIVVGVVAGYVVLSALLWRRFSWSTKSAVSLLVLLGLLAATAWLHNGLSNGINLLYQPTSNVLGGLTLLTILLAGIILMQWRFMPLLARLPVCLVAIYGLAAGGLGIAAGIPYSDLFHGRSLWDRLPFWLQGAFVSALVFVPLVLLVHLVYGALRVRGQRLWTWGVQALVLSLGVAVAAAGFVGSVVPTQVGVVPPPSMSRQSVQPSQPSTAQPSGSTQQAETQGTGSSTQVSPGSQPSQTSQTPAQSTAQQAGPGGTQPAVPESSPAQPQQQAQPAQPAVPTPSLPQVAVPQASPPEGTAPAPQPAPPEAAPAQPQAASPTGPTPSPQPAAMPTTPPGSPAPPEGSFKGSFYFTTYGFCRDMPNGKSANVLTVSFSYKVGSEFALEKPEGIACTKDSVDGLIVAPDGTLLVSAKGDGVHRVNVRDGALSTIKTSVPAFHIMLDTNGKVWVSSIPGVPATIDLAARGKVTVHTLKGDDTAITTIAWDNAGNAYYTSSGPFGGGNFGRLNLTTLTTKRILSGLPAAHGMAFDPYTQSLILMGANHITQVSTGTSPTIISDLIVSADPLDQGTVDGKGHIFAACNCGRMIFVDYSVSRKVADPSNFKAAVQLIDALDDIAPLVGPGSASFTPPKTAQVTEEKDRIRIVLESEILFDLNKYNLKPSAEAALAQIKASIIDQHPGARLIVEGHSDDRGTQGYNKTLSTRRAQSVATWLNHYGIEGSLMQTVGYGKSRPRVPNTNEGNRARNRRVEIIVLK